MNSYRKTKIANIISSDHTYEQIFFDEKHL
jgi:hypothetical protein